jgi:hypothetical protein
MAAAAGDVSQCNSRTRPILQRTTPARIALVHVCDFAVGLCNADWGSSVDDLCWQRGTLRCGPRGGYRELSQAPDASAPTWPAPDVAAAKALAGKKEVFPVNVRFSVV